MNSYVFLVEEGPAHRAKMDFAVCWCVHINFKFVCDEHVLSVAYMHEYAHSTLQSRQAW